MKRSALPLVGLILFPGCNNEYLELENQIQDIWLEFFLERDTTTAGQALGYTAELVTLDGERIPVQPSLTSDIEALLPYDEASISPTLAGTHTLTVLVDYQDQDFLYATTLDVEPGDPAGIDLQLQDMAMNAGETITWTVSLWDTYGNALDSSMATVSTDSTALELGDGTVTGTQPGFYSLLAQASSQDSPEPVVVSDNEDLVIYASSPASISLELSDTELEVNETTSATVTVLDAYGNECDDDWYLEVQADAGADPSSVTISYNNLTFWQEGIFTVLAKVQDQDGNILSDSVGPLLIDSTGPLLDIQEPTRGDWSTSTTGPVTGTVSDQWSGVVDLTVNGQEVPIAGDGSFSTTIDHDFGVTTVETVAIDGDSNTTSDTRALLSDSFLSYGSGLANGIVARINEDGLNTLESLAEGLISDTDLDSLIPNPVYDEYSEDCIDVWFDEWCFTWYSIELYVENPSIGDVVMDLDPRTGYIHATFTVYDTSLDFSADGVVAEIGASGSGWVTADSITATMDLSPNVSGGQLYFTVSGVSVSTSGFDFYLDSWIYDVLDFFGLDDDVDDLIKGYMEDAIVSAVESEVPAALEDALQGLELSSTLDLMENTYSITAQPYDIEVDSSGLSLSLQSWFTTDSWESSHTGLGSLYGAYSVPSFASTPGMILSMSLDFLNQALYAFWGGGILDMQMSGEEMGLDVSDLEMFFSDITELNISTEALLPPVVLPGTGSSLLDLQAGDLLITIYGGPAEEGNEMLQAYVTIFGGLDVNISGSSLLPVLGDVDVVFDVVYPEGNSVAATDTEAFLQAMVPLFLPVLTDALAEIPIPEISGFTLTNMDVSLDGADNGYLDLAGDLLVE